MPLTPKGSEILGNMKEQYGEEKGKSVFYASRNKGTISGVDTMNTSKDNMSSSALNSSGVSSTAGPTGIITGDVGASSTVAGKTTGYNINTSTDTDDAGTSEGAKKAAQTRKQGGVPGGRAAQASTIQAAYEGRAQQRMSQGKQPFPTRYTSGRSTGDEGELVLDEELTPERQDELQGDIPKETAKEPKDRSTLPESKMPAPTMTASLVPVTPLSIPVGDQSLSNMNNRNRSFWRR